MSLASPLVDRVVEALLYEGYLLYPYRPSVKNVRRWTFGAVYPRTFVESEAVAERWCLQCQCLIAGEGSTTVRAQARFLHLIDRSTERDRQPESTSARDTELSQNNPYACPAGEPWQEAVERRVDVEPCTLDELLNASRRWPFEFPAERTRETIVDPAGRPSVILRRQETVTGIVELSAQRVAGDSTQAILLTARIINESSSFTGMGDGETGRRDREARLRTEAMLRSFASTHLVLGVERGVFISSLDPPPELRDICQRSHNEGLWPVLVGDPGQTDVMLCSPIILYDYPQIAPESPGNLFDATEIDEILTLRILTLTDEEKRQIGAGDERGRALLERTHALAEGQLAQLHGAVRSLRSIEESLHVE